MKIEKQSIIKKDIILFCKDCMHIFTKVKSITESKITRIILNSPSLQKDNIENLGIISFNKYKRAIRQSNEKIIDDIYPNSTGNPQKKNK